jgi:nucleoid-associated protein YgaU
MGLFSFLKNAGSKIFGREEEVATVAPEVLKAQKEKALRGVIGSLQLPIDNLDVQVADDVVTVYGETSSQANKEKAVLALGNVEGVAAVDDRISLVAPPATFYEVKSGDSLSKISKEHYGDPMKYMSIFEANKPMLKDPNEIYPGQVLRIPAL